MLSVRKNLVRRIRKRIIEDYRKKLIEDYRKNFQIAMAEVQKKGDPLLGALFIFAGISAAVCFIFWIK